MHLSNKCLQEFKWHQQQRRRGDSWGGAAGRKILLCAREDGEADPGWHMGHPMVSHLPKNTGKASGSLFLLETKIPRGNVEP